MSERFNYTRLETLYEGDSELHHYHRGIISILHNPENDNYMNYLSKVIIASDHVGMKFIVLNPELSLKQLRNGVKYKMTLHDCSECEDELLILNFIIKESEALAKRILLENEQEIANSIFSEAQNADDKKGKFDLLVFIHINCPEMFKMIFSKQARNTKLFEKIPRLLKGKMLEKRIARLYVYLMRKYARDPSLEIFNLELRYPSVRKFDIADFS